MLNFDNRPNSAKDQKNIQGGVAWTQGLQLMPQHFQVSDQSLLQTIWQTSYASTHFFWGLHSLSLDKLALSQRKLRILHASGIFSNGVIFTVEENDIPDYDLVAEDGSMIRYSLKIERTLNNMKNSSGSFELSGPIECYDSFGAEDPIDIFFKRPKITVDIYNPKDSKNLHIPFIEINYQNLSVISTDYHPACPLIIVNSKLWDNITDLTKRVRNQLFLLSVEPYPNKINKDYNNNLVIFISSILPHLMRLEGGLASRSMPLSEVYNTLLSLVGSILAFNAKIPKSVPIYDHEDPFNSIMSLVGLVDHIVGSYESNKTVWKRLPGTPKDSYWVFTVDGNLKQRLIFCVYYDNTSINTVSTWVEKVLICWESDYNKCRETRVKGLQRVILRNPQFVVSSEDYRNYIAFEVEIEIPYTSSGSQQLVIERPNLRTLSIVSSIEMIMEVE